MKKLMALVLSFAMVFSAVPVFAATPEARNSTDIAGATIETIADQPYNDSAVTLEAKDITVTYGTKTLVPETDYTVGEFANNEKPGKASFKVIGTAIGTASSGYTGSQEATFNITKAFTPAEVAAIAEAMGPIKDQVKGTEFECPEVKWKDITLVKGTDYDVTASTATVGEQTATIEFKGVYSGEKITKTFKVVEPKKDMNDAVVYFKSNTKYTFTGSEVKPEVSVGYKGVMLTEGTDYTVSYSTNNVNATASTASKGEKAKVIVTGCGDFDGVIEKEFTIEQANMEDVTVTLEKDAYTVTGEPIQPVITSAKLGDYELNATDYKFSYGENKEIGEGTVTLTANKEATGSGNFTDSVTVKFVIAAKTAEDFDITLAEKEFKYDGTAKTPAVTVKDGTTVLKEGTDYTVSYENNVNSGTAKAVVTGMGAYAGSKSVDFKIIGKKASIFTKANSFVKFYPQSKAFNVYASVKAADATGFTYKSLDPEIATVDEKGTVTIVNSGIARIQIDTVGTKAYNPITKIVTVKVKPLKPKFTLSSAAKGKLKATVTKEVGATRYEVRYGRMGVYKIKSITHKDTAFTKTSYTVSKLKSGKYYYVKVRAVKVMADGTTVYGNWSATKKLKVK